MDPFNFPHQNPNSSPTTATSSSSSSFHGHKTKKRSISKSTSTLSTDPQSVAARERRHRISDRFKILGTMVPGGAKMDTVSMLDEAISYVKFLKAQIWFHHNMLLFLNDDHNDKTNDDYVPGTEMYSQEMPVMVTTDSVWFGSAEDEHDETMHRRGLS